MKEYKIEYNSFIGGWFIPGKICDDIINFFKKNKKNAVNGNYGTDKDKKNINKDVKDSLDLKIENNNFNYPFNEYREHLQNCLNEYLKKYPDANNCDRFNVSDFYNIQYYPINGGFKKWHYESATKDSSKRNLVFMTYLNNVKNAGTEFKYQKIKTECKKGLTLIWPTAFTHTHKGIINKKNEKYIITGWYSYL
jgi:hypothetical protein